VTTTTEPETTGTLFGGMTNRVYAGILGVVALLLFVAMLSYSPYDPSFLNATSAPASNWLGGLGAQMSALLLLTIGRTAALIPVVLGIWAIRLWTGSWDRLVIVPLRLIGAGFAAVVTTSAFLSAMPGRIEGLLGHGGWLGDFVIRPFARGLAALDFSAPFQIPGLIFCLLAILTIALACGVTREEAEWFKRHIVDSYRQVFSRENRAALTENTLTRTRDLTRKLRPVVMAENPPTLEGFDPPAARRPAPMDVAPLHAPVDEPEEKTAPPVRADAPAATPGTRKRKAAMKRRKSAGGDRILPPLDLLAKPQRGVRPATQQELRGESAELLKVLDDYGVKGEITDNLPLALGKEIDGSIKFESLAKMPHLLVAGTTGAGKSVAINSMILSLLYRHTPDECRLIMIDPKMLELSVYDGIPHLLSPVVTDPKKAVMALKWVVREMESRYQKMAAMNVRGIEGYNLKMRAAQQAGEQLTREALDERITRVHGPFVSDEEVERVADELRAHGEEGDQVTFDEPEGGNSEIDQLLGLGGDNDDQTLYDQAVAIVAHDRRATISYIQRRLQIGYNRAARLIEQMEEQGIVTPANNAGKREILIEAR